METELFVIEKSTLTIPLLANIPHSSIYIPSLIRPSFALSENGLNTELLKMTDWFVDDLFSKISTIGGVVAKCNVSRLVVDPERFEDDEKESMVCKGMGVIYTKTHDGRSLRKHLPSDIERDDLLNRYYRPYHKAVQDEAQAMLDLFGQCLILDCHSFSSKPLPYELVQDPNMPDICLGTDQFHTTKDLIEAIGGFFHKHDFSMALNRPFEGTYVPLKFLGKDERVSSIMIEINRRLYLDEDTGQKSDGFGKIKDMLGDVVQSLRAGYLNM